MNLADTARVLTKISAYDRRTIGEADVAAWHEVLGDLEAGDCLAAVAAYYTTETRWLMPADVRAYAEAAAKRRKAAARRQLLRDAGWPDSEGTTAVGPPTRDRSAEIDASLRRLAAQKAIASGTRSDDSHRSTP